MPGTRPGMTTTNIGALPNESSFPSRSGDLFLVGGLIHQAAEFAAIRNLQLEEPGLVGGVGIDQRRLAREFGVDLQYLARNRRIDVGGGLDRFHDGGGFCLLQGAADLRQFDEYDVAELGLRVIRHPDGSDIAFDAEPFVVGGVQRRHERSFSVYRRWERRASASRVAPVAGRALPRIRPR